MDFCDFIIVADIKPNQKAFDNRLRQFRKQCWATAEKAIWTDSDDFGFIFERKMEIKQLNWLKTRTILDSYFFSYWYPFNLPNSCFGIYFIFY